MMTKKLYSKIVFDNVFFVCENGPDKKYDYLVTREYYDDFDLTVEFKQEADGNSGLFFRSFVEPSVKVNGWHCEVAPKGQHTGGIYESYGRNRLIPPPADKESVLKEGFSIETWYAASVNQ